MRKQRKYSPNAQFQNDNSEVDMTPMLDIVFIMLIFFIVTTTFIKTSGIEVSRPSKTSDHIDEQKSILIKAASNEELTLNGRVILIDSVQANVESELAKNPKLAVAVQVNQLIHTGKLVRIVDQVRLAGINNVTVSRLQKHL